MKHTGMLVTRAGTEGTVAAIPSKSDVHRALIAAALSNPPTRVLCRGTSDDIEATASCLAALGARVTREEDGFVVGSGATPAEAALDAAESGSTLRFILPVAAALGGSYAVSGRGRLPERPISELLFALAEHGVEFSAPRLPLSFKGKASGGVYTLSGNVTSQFITGLMLALPLTGEACEIVLTTPLESAPYVDMTRQTLRRFGVTWEKAPNGFRLASGAAYCSPGSYLAEGDWSSAAFPLVMGALGERVTVTGLRSDTLQADRAILDALILAGASVSVEGGAVTVSGGVLRAFDFDVSSCPDLFPVLAVLAAGAKGESRLFGGKRLRLKESDRIRTTADLLISLGGDVTELEDGLLIRGGKRLLGGTVDGAGDHRIVMAAAVARAIAGGDIEILGAGAVTKSYPGFFGDLARLKGASHEIGIR